MADASLETNAATVADEHYDIIVVGGGAAGFFCAIRCAEINPDLKIVILEKSDKLLSKVKISGGGRCNVTHACFDPRDMVEHYPRGRKELLGPFHRFLCGDMMAWLEDHGVATKIETDGRVFPVSNKSQDIINCFMRSCTELAIEIKTQCGAKKIYKSQENWIVENKINTISCNKVFYATGSSPAAWKIAESLGHSIIPPVPSLFTFNIDSPLLKDIPGISVPMAHVSLNEFPFQDSGPLLITHWGLSGPAILKISAWAANELAACQYTFSIAVNWVNQDEDSIKNKINELRKSSGNQLVNSTPLFELPKRLWAKFIFKINIHNKNYASLTSSDITNLIHILHQCPFQVKGKSTFKAEFVTCGGIDTKEVNFKTMESKVVSGLYFGGEVLNIDAITGGFNFQAAWTEAYIAAEAIAVK